MNAGAKAPFWGWVRGKRIRDSASAVYTGGGGNFLPPPAFKSQRSTEFFRLIPSANRIWTLDLQPGRDASPQASADGSESRPYLFKSPIPNGNWY